MPTPEELARINIDHQLTACGWTMQLCSAQIEAINNLEKSLAENRPRTLPHHPGFCVMVVIKYDWFPQ